MNKLVYRANDIIDLHFGLNIEGTKHEPSEVAIKICCNKQNYGVIAEFFDNEYHAKFNLGNIPGIDTDTQLDFSIEVTLNGRVFKPFKRKLSITDYEDLAPTDIKVNKELDKEIEHTKIKETTQKVYEKVDQEVIDNSKPYTIPSWAKSILQGNEIPQDLEKQFDKVAASVQPTEILKPVEKKKVTIKFDKPKIKEPILNKVKESFEAPVIDIAFNNNKIKKKPIKKKEKKESFTITEGKVIYL